MKRFIGIRTDSSSLSYKNKSAQRALTKANNTLRNFQEPVFLGSYEQSSTIFVEQPPLPEKNEVLRGTNCSLGFQQQSVAHNEWMLLTSDALRLAHARATLRSREHVSGQSGFSSTASSAYSHRPCSTTVESRIVSP